MSLAWFLSCLISSCLTFSACNAVYLRSPPSKNVVGGRRRKEESMVWHGTRKRRAARTTGRGRHATTLYLRRPPPHRAARTSVSLREGIDVACFASATSRRRTGTQQRTTRAHRARARRLLRAHAFHTAAYYDGHGWRHLLPVWWRVPLPTLQPAALSNHHLTLTLTISMSPSSPSWHTY